MPSNFAAGLQDLWQLCLTLVAQAGIVTCRHNPGSSHRLFSTNDCTPVSFGKVLAFVQGNTKQMRIALNSSLPFHPRGSPAHAREQGSLLIQYWNSRQAEILRNPWIAGRWWHTLRTHYTCHLSPLCFGENQTGSSYISQEQKSDGLAPSSFSFQDSVFSSCAQSFALFFSFFSIKSPK